MFSHPWAAEIVNELFIECSSSSNAPHPHVQIPVPGTCDYINYKKDFESRMKVINQ